MEQYKGSAILEVQARSCEYSHMFKLDGMRAALLEHIPPLDESTYTRNLGNSQAIDSAGAAQVSPSLTPLHSSGCSVWRGHRQGMAKLVSKCCPLWLCDLAAIVLHSALFATQKLSSCTDWDVSTPCISICKRCVA